MHLETCKTCKLKLEVYFWRVMVRPPPGSCLGLRSHQQYLALAVTTLVSLRRRGKHFFQFTLIDFFQQIALSAIFLLGAVLCLASGQRYYGSDQTETYGNSAVPYVYRYRQRGPLSKRNVNEFQGRDYFANVRRRRSIIPDLLQRRVVVKRATVHRGGSPSCNTSIQGRIVFLTCTQEVHGTGLTGPEAFSSSNYASALRGGQNRG